MLSGGSQTLNTGATVTSSNWSTSGGDVLNLNKNLTLWRNVLGRACGTTFSIGGSDRFTLTGISTLGGTINGAVELSR